MGRRKSRIVWSRLAELDLESAHEYLAKRNSEAARRFAAGILDALARIRRHPEIGAPATDLIPEGKYRHVICGRYRIIYRLAEGAVVILRIWDTRRNPDDMIPE